MSTQFFPNIEDVFDLLMSELPEGVYADDRSDDPDPEKRSYSSAELRAQAAMFAGIYENLRLVNNDKFASTVTLDGISRWEVDYFKDAQDSNISFSNRKIRLFTKLQSVGGISLPAMKKVIGSILDPEGLAWDILPYSGQNNGSINGAWIFEYSRIDLDTFLAKLDPIIGSQQSMGLTQLSCDLNWASAGITEQDLLDIQETAYKYEVRIFGNADAITLTILEKQLTAFEPARSSHYIRNNSTGAVLP